MDSKPVQKLFQGLSLVLFDVKDIVRDSRWSPIDKVLFSEQRCELIEGGNVSVREIDEPFQRCVCQRAHQQLAVHIITSFCKHHLGVERCEVSLWVLYTREGDFRA